MTEETIASKVKKFFFACEENNYQPFIYKGNFFFFLIFSLICLRAFALPLYFYFPRTIFFADMTATEVINLLNSERKELGLNPLQINSKLNEAAILKAKDMMAKDYFSHTSPSGVSPWEWIRRAGYQYTVAGENLAIGFLDSTEVHQAWNDSSSHRQNLLDKRFEEVGVAVLTGDFAGNETTIVVELFGTPLGGLNFIGGDSSSPEEAEKTSQINELGEEKLVGGESSSESTMAGALTKEQSQEEKKESILQGNFWQFFVKKYDLIIQDNILILALFFLLIFLLNFFIISRTFILGRSGINFLKMWGPKIAAIVILFLLGLADKTFFLKILPHNLRI